MIGRTALNIDKKRVLRHAIEIRHESFVDESFIALLRKYKVALVVADTAGKWPYYEDVTADFMYLRLHGDTELYASGYSDEALVRWAGKIRTWAGGGQPEASSTDWDAGLRDLDKDLDGELDDDARGSDDPPLPDA